MRGEPRGGAGMWDWRELDSMRKTMIETMIAMTKTIM